MAAHSMSNNSKANKQFLQLFYSQHHSLLQKTSALLPVSIFQLFTIRSLYLHLWTLLMFFMPKMKHRDPVVVCFIHGFGWFTRMKMLRANCLVFHVVSVDFILWNGSKPSSSSFQWQPIFLYSVVIYLLTGILLNETLCVHPLSQQLLITQIPITMFSVCCKKMADAWAK